MTGWSDSIGSSSAAEAAVWKLKRLPKRWSSLARRLCQGLPVDLDRIRILFEDETILVVDKPAGLLTIATETEKENTLYAALRARASRKHPAGKNIHCASARPRSIGTPGLCEDRRGEGKPPESIRGSHCRTPLPGRSRGTNRQGCFFRPILPGGERRLSRLFNPEERSG